LGIFVHARAYRLEGEPTWNGDGARLSTLWVSIETQITRGGEQILSIERRYRGDTFSASFA
jgi:hypothetical protein